MKKILFLTDFSANANNAYVYALSMAHSLGAEVTVLHVYSLPDIKEIRLPRTLQDVYQSIELESFENLRDNVPMLRSIAEDHDLSAVPVYHALLEGEPIKTICGYAEKHEFDLIVMGTKGATGLKEVFIGSVTAKVMEKTNKPLLAVPDVAQYDGKIDRVAMTTEFKSDELAALNYLLPTIRTINAKLYGVHVGSTTNEKVAAEKLAWENYLIKDKDAVTIDIVDAIDIEKALMDYFDKNKIDIVAMLTHKKGFFKRLFDYSVTKRMIYHLKTPILVIPETILV